MRVRGLFWLVAAFALFGMPVHAEEGSSRAAPQAFVAAAVPDQLPLAARDAAGALIGFDIEVARGIAERLGGSVTFVTPGWERILSGNWGGEWNYAVASITPTERRKEKLDFPAIYRFDAAVLLVRKGDTRIDKPANASGKTIGVMRDTTFEKYLQRDLTLYPHVAPVNYVIDNAQIRTYPSKESAMQALINQEVDAVVTTFVTAKEAIDGGTAVEIVPGFLFFEPVAVATVKGDAAFGDRIREAVDAMRQDGTLGKLSVKWLGIDLSTALP